MTWNITVLRPTLVSDPFSGEDSTESWDAPERIPLPVIAVAPGDAAESHDAAAPDESIEATIYASPDADVRASDRIEVDGETYMVVGRPARWESPFSSWHPGIVVKIARLTHG